MPASRFVIASTLPDGRGSVWGSGQRWRVGSRGRAVVGLMSRQGADQAECGARVVVVLVLSVFGIAGKVLAYGIRVAAHRMERQGQNGLRESRVAVGILGPAVHQ